jgi:hypothetical protein
MEERLKYIFELVNDWLKFAEAKNGALLVAASGLAFATAKQLSRLSNNPCQHWWCSMGIGLLLISVLLCLFSLLPQVNFLWPFSLRETSHEDNLFFFGHIAGYSAQNYLAALYAAENLVSAERKLELDLAAQIVTNSRLTSRKFGVSRIAGWPLLAGTAIITVVSAIHVLWR